MEKKNACRWHEGVRSNIETQIRGGNAGPEHDLITFTMECLVLDSVYPVAKMKHVLVMAEPADQVIVAGPSEKTIVEHGAHKEIAVRRADYLHTARPECRDQFGIGLGSPITELIMVHGMCTPKCLPHRALRRKSHLMYS